MWWSPENPHSAHRGELSLDVEPEFPGSPPRGDDPHLTITVGVRRDDGFRCRIRIACCDVRDILGGLLRLARESQTQFRLGREKPDLDIYAKFDPRHGLMVTIDEISLGLGALENRRLNSEGSARFLEELLNHVPTGNESVRSLAESEVRKYSSAIQLSDIPDPDEPHVSIEVVWSRFTFWDSPDRFIRVVDGFLRRSSEIMANPTVAGKSLSAQRQAAVRSLGRTFGLSAPRPKRRVPRPKV